MGNQTDGGIFVFAHRRSAVRFTALKDKDVVFARGPAEGKLIAS